jgi:hypothetical protein
MKVLTNHLEMQEDEAKGSASQEKSRQCHRSLFAYPLGQSIPNTKEDTLPRVGRRQNTLIFA